MLLAIAHLLSFPKFLIFQAQLETDLFQSIFFEPPLALDSPERTVCFFLRGLSVLGVEIE